MGQIAERHAPSKRLLMGENHLIILRFPETNPWTGTSGFPETFSKPGN
jgi:hypothetical protein